MIVNYQDKRMVLSCYHVLVPDYQFRPGNEIGQPSTGKRVALLHKAIINSTIDAPLAVIQMMSEFEK